jgi:hypothetical protein
MPETIKPVVYITCLPDLGTLNRHEKYGCWACLSVVVTAYLLLWP